MIDPSRSHSRTSERTAVALNNFLPVKWEIRMKSCRPQRPSVAKVTLSIIRPRRRSGNPILYRHRSGVNQISLKSELSEVEQGTVCMYVCNEILLHLRSFFFLILGLCLEYETFIRGVVCPNLFVCVFFCPLYVKKWIFKSHMKLLGPPKYLIFFVLFYLCDFLVGWCRKLSMSRL